MRFSYIFPVHYLVILMSFPVPPEDRPDPSEQPIRARVPEHVARGSFSTGVIIMTAQTEIILDFIQNLGRPHQVVARIVLPHGVLPQLVDALHRNMDLYKSRWGELPHLPQLPPVQTNVSGQVIPAAQPASPGQVNHPEQASAGTGGGSGAGPAEAVGGAAQNPAPPKPAGGFQDAGTRRPSAQEIYDDLKIRDELLSGVYANAVMIGHGPHEFSFDFITNFFPHSAVSSRVFLSAGQVPRFYDSLKGTWDQLRLRMGPQQQPPNDSPESQPDIDPFS
jgi:hypothetical protein